MYCFKCKEKIDSKNPRIVKTKNERIMLLSNCAVCNSKKNQDSSKNRKQKGCWIIHSVKFWYLEVVKIIIVKNRVYLSIYYGCTYKVKK